MRYLLAVLLLFTLPVQAASCERYLQLKQAEQGLSEDEYFDLVWSDQESSGFYFNQAVIELQDSPEWAAVEILRRRIKALYQQLGKGRGSFSSIRVPLAVESQCKEQPGQSVSQALMAILDAEIQALHKEATRLEQKIEQNKLPTVGG